MRFKFFFPLLAVALLASPQARAADGPGAEMDMYASGGNELLGNAFVMSFKEQIKAADKRIAPKSKLPAKTVIARILSGKLVEGLPAPIAAPRSNFQRPVRSTFVPNRSKKYAPFSLKAALQNSRGGSRYLRTGKVGN